MSEIDGVDRFPNIEIPRLSVGRYSSRDIAPADRHEAWRQRDWPSVAPMFETRPLEPFEVETRTLRLGALQILNTSITGQSYERTDAMLRSSDPDILGVQFMAEGEAQGLFGDTSFRHVAGSLLFGNMAQASKHVSTASRTATLFIPRATAKRLGIDPDAANGQVVGGASARLLGSHLLQLVEAAPMLPVTAQEQLSRTVLDLLAVAAGTLGSAGPCAGKSAIGTRSSRALAEIESRLGSPTLTAGNLARSLGISRSSLHRLFAEEGGVRAYVRERRLQAARCALQDRRDRESVGSIAERLGFSDAAHLSRLFRDRFGVTPTAARKSFRADFESDLDCDSQLF